MRRVTGSPNPPYAFCSFALARRCKILWRPSERAAASIAPDGAVGADAGARHHHDRTHDPGSNHDDATIGTASAVGTAMVAEAPSARGVRPAQARERDADHNRFK